MKLKTKLSKLRHDGRITNAEYSIIINALNRKPKERVIAEIKFDEDTLRKLVKDKVDELTTKFATRPCEDAISRAEALRIAKSYYHAEYVVDKIRQLPSVTPEAKWIPVSERLPEDLVSVNITWVNHEPEPYYHDIKDRNFEATGIHYRGQWYWYSTTCADYLGEYGSNDADRVDDAIEIVAWMPLPEPYKAESEG